MLYIGIDLGTSAVKLLLMDSEGNIRNIVSREYPLYFPHPGWSEQKPEDWYEQTMEGIRELLKDAGFDFDILLSKTPDSVNEDVLPGESPENYVARVTREKAKWGRKVAETERDLLLPVLAADTTVALNGKIYGKPADEKEAFEFLKDFSGQTHEVLTAVCLVDKEGKPRETLTKTFVTFRPLTDEEINSYIASGEAFDKAGGYGIQGLAGQFVEKVEGSYSGVIGLPVDETKALLAEIGIRPR